MEKEKTLAEEVEDAEHSDAEVDTTDDKGGVEEYWD